jgi:xylulokinase
MDHSTATTMYLYEQAAGRKNEALIERLGLKPPMISDLLPTGSLLGRISPEARARTGLNEGTQAFLGCFDHPGAARALEIRGRRQLLMSCGTSWVGLVVLGDRGEGIARGMLVDPYESASGGGWCGMFSLAGMGKRFDSWIVEAFRQGAALRELDSACPAPSMEEFLRTMNRVAAAVDPLGRIPAIDLKTMKPDPETVESLLRTHSAGELFRALMESAAFEFRSLLLDKGIGLDAIDEVFLVGGPSGSIVWRQIIADTLAKPLTVRYGKTAGAAGAARIAAKASGFPLGSREPEAKIDPCPRAVDAVDARYRRFRERRDEGR